MPIHRLSTKASERFAEIPEFSMGIQIGTIGDTLALILGAQIAIEVTDAGQEAWGKAVSKLLEETAQAEDFAVNCLDWTKNLDTIEPKPAESQSLAILSKQQLTAVVAFVMPTAPFVPSPPTSPTYVYGHLPFIGCTSAKDRFLRFEPWPTSRRLNLSAKTVSAGTYAAPFSERHLVPNGFAAIGRYALPNLLPACTVWEIVPPSGTRLAVGTSVPLYGQAGGGAEVCFQTHTSGVSISSLPTLPVV